MIAVDTTHQLFINKRTELTDNKNTFQQKFLAKVYKVSTSCLGPLGVGVAVGIADL